MPWYCVYTAAKSEVVADQALRERRFTTFLPSESIVRANGQRHIGPLFPRYMFVQLDVHVAGWRAVFSTRGVEWVFCDGARFADSPNRRPVPVPQGAVDVLLGQCEPNGVIYRDGPQKLSKDDTGRVVAGPFAEFTGICSRAKRDRVWLLLSIMGRRTEVEFARDAVVVE